MFYFIISSDSGTGSTSDQDQPLLSPASGQFSWPGPGPRAGCDNQSVSSVQHPS